MNKIWERMAKQRLYRVPEKQLEMYGQMFSRLRASGLSSSEINMRFRRKQSRVEGFHAAAFCYGIQLAGEDFPVGYSMWEDSDHDFVFRTGTEPVANYFRAQLKEFVPPSLSSAATFQDILDKLANYADPSDLNLIIYHGREGLAGPIGQLPSKIALNSLWIVGLVSTNPARFILAGDYMQPKENQKCFEFGLQHNQLLHQTRLRRAGEQQSR
jgi:hypothetical protein